MHTHTSTHKYYIVREEFCEPLLALIMCEACLILKILFSTYILLVKERSAGYLMTP